MNVLNIGILEDNPPICEYMAIALEIAGHHVDIHTQAVSLLATLFSASGVRTPLPYHLVTVDLMLPGEITGLEVITSIRKNIPANKLPIIVISGLAQSQLEEVHKTFPDIPILQKPFRAKVLLKLIEDIFISSTKGLS